jgi:hypothetical protein
MTMSRGLKKATSTTTRGVPNDKVKTGQAAKGKPSSTRPKNLKNKLVVPKEASNVDPFVRMKVAFHLDGPDRPHWLGNDYLPYGKTSGSNLYLFGIVLSRDKVTKTGCAYRIEWEHTSLGESTIELNVLQPAIELAKKVCTVLEDESKHPLGVDILHFLRANDGSMPGMAIPNDDEGNDKGNDKASHDDDKKEGLDNDEEQFYMEDDNSINFAFPSFGRIGREPTTQQDGLSWVTNIPCPALCRKGRPFRYFLM